MPFRNAVQSPNQVVGLQTLVWHLMQRRIQYVTLDSVSLFAHGVYLGVKQPCIQVENARAALDLYRSDSTNWEASIANQKWACALPPSSYSRCYL